MGKVNIKPKVCVGVCGQTKIKQNTENYEGNRQSKQMKSFCKHAAMPPKCRNLLYWLFSWACCYLARLINWIKFKWIRTTLIINYRAKCGLVWPDHLFLVPSLTPPKDNWGQKAPLYFFHWLRCYSSVESNNREWRLPNFEPFLTKECYWYKIQKIKLLSSWLKIGLAILEIPS